MRYFYTLIACGVPHRQIPKSFCQELKRLESMQILDISAQKCALKSQFIIGSVDIARSGTVFLQNLNVSKGDLKLEGGKYARLRQGDIILAKVLHRGRRGLDGGGRAKFIQILYSPKSHSIAVLKMKKGSIKALELAIKNKKECWIDLKASQKSLRALPKDCVVKIECASANIVQVLGVLNEASVDEKIVLERYERIEPFSVDSERFAQAFGQSVDPQMYPDREDLQYLPFCVIDPSDAKDHDDAICFDSKTRTLYVAIADVSEYVSVGSALDSEALARGFSVYLPHKVVPMLPFALSAGICSLRQDATRLAMVWKIKLNTKAQVVESHLVEAVIKVCLSVSYERVQEFLDTGVGMPRPVASWLKAFVPYVKKIRDLRLHNGYEFENQEVKLALDSQMHLVDLKLINPSFSHHIIEEAMLLANVQSAKMLKDNVPKGFYRIHPPPKDERVRELALEFRRMGFEVDSTQDIHQFITSLQAQVKGSAMAGVLNGIIIRSFAKARYDEEGKGHFGLGFECYTHFTSPIRRYGDLLVHRILKAILRKERSLVYLLEGLGAKVSELNLKEKEVSGIELEFTQRTLARYAQSCLQSKPLILNALVLDDVSYCVALDGIPSMRILLPYSLDRFGIVEVRIVKVDLCQNLVFGEVLLESKMQKIKEI